MNGFWVGSGQAGPLCGTRVFGIGPEVIGEERQLL